MAERTTNEFITLLRQNSGISAVKAYYDSEAARLTSESFATEAPNVPVKIYTSNEDGTYTATDIEPLIYSSLHYSSMSAGKVRNIETPTVVEGQYFISTIYDPRVASVFLNGSLLMPNDIDYTATPNSITLTSPIEKTNGEIDELQIISGAILPVTLDTKPIYVATLSEMLNTNPAGASTVIWTDNNRGGIFNYDTSRIAENDSGTVFNGWVRLFNGAVNAKWFGDMNLELTYEKASLVSQSVEVDVGAYNLDANIIDFTGVKFHAFGTVTIDTNLTLSVTNITI